jgi:hypothetical protein
VQFDGTIPLYARLTLPILILSFRILKLAAGCFIFCRRNAFERVGGFSEEIYASEEVWLSRALAREGRFVILRESVTTSGRKVRTHSVWEVIGVVLRAMMFWRRPLKQRSGFELWYGPRRADPEEEAGSPDDAAQMHPLGSFACEKLMKLQRSSCLDIGFAANIVRNRSRFGEARRPQRS